jgi:chemotaxis protein MotB
MASRHFSGHAEEEEGYFVSMTDMLVGLLFIFIIMLMFFAMRFQEAAKQQNDVTQKKDSMIEKLTDSERTRATILQNIGQFLQSRGINVVILKDEGVLRLPEDILFSKANWELNTKGVEAVKTLANALDQVLPCYTIGTQSKEDGCPKLNSKIEAIFIEGHADADAYSPQRPGVTQPANAPPSSSLLSIFRNTPPPPTKPSTPRVAAPPKDNLDLSALRATSTFRELLQVNQGLSSYLSPESKPVLSVSGYGEYRPVTPLPGETLESYKQRNRRIDLRILMANPTSEGVKEMQENLENSGLHQ